MSLTFKEKVKVCQAAVKAKVDGSPGPQTYDLFYRNLVDHIELPYQDRHYGCNVIFGDPEKTQMLRTNGIKEVKDFLFSISATFSWPSGKTPISILVDKGKVLVNTSCRYWAGFPETVLYYTKRGKFGTRLIKTAAELPTDVLWAVGGGDIMNFRAKEEGFCTFYVNGKKYNHADVFRRTAHVAIGVDPYGYVVGVYHPSCLMTDFRRRCLDIGFVKGIFLDGGHISAMNGDLYKNNTRQNQACIIKF